MRSGDRGFKEAAIDSNERERPPHVRVGGRRIAVPRSPTARIVIGSSLIVGGLLGFLPVLGFWMIPLGLLILAHDFPIARRIVRAGRRAAIRVWRQWRGRKNRTTQSESGSGSGDSG